MKRPLVASHRVEPIEGSPTAKVRPSGENATLVGCQLPIVVIPVALPSGPRIRVPACGSLATKSPGATSQTCTPLPVVTTRAPSGEIARDPQPPETDGNLRTSLAGI